MELNTVSNISRALKVASAVSFLTSGILIAQEYDDELVELSPFIVNTDADSGYYASNSISATKTNVAIQDLPMNLQVLTRDFIEDVGSVTIEDVMQYSATATPSTNEPGRFALRGFTNPSPMRNGIDTLSEANFVSTLTTERIEVVKGPSAILYGITEPGGLINIITKKPWFSTQGSVVAQYGSYDTWKAEVDVTGPLTDEDGMVAYRVIAGASHIGYEADFTEDNATTVAPSLLFRFSRDTTLLAAFEYQKLDKVPEASAITKFAEDGSRIGFVQGFYYDLPVTFNHQGPDAKKNSEATFSTLDFQHQFFDDRFALRLVVSHSTTDLDQDTRIGAGNEIRGTDGEYGWVRTHLLARVVDREETVFQGELTGRFDVGSITHRVLLGAEATKYEQDQVAYRQNNALPLMDLRDPSTWDFSIPIAPEDRSARPSDFFSDQETQSFYVVHQAELFSSRLHTMLGARYDVVEASSLNRSTSPASYSEVPTTRNWTPQVGALFDVTEDLGVYAAYSESFSPNTSVNPDGSLFDPATGEGIDIGFKFNSKDNRYNATVSYFDIRKTNIVRQDVERRENDPEGRLWFAASGEERSQGLEVELVVTPFDGYQVSAGYVYMDAYVVSNDDAPDEVGNPLAFAPEHSFSFWNKYTFQDDSSLAGFYVGGGVTSRSKSYANTQTRNLSRPLFDYTTLDLLFGYKGEIGEFPFDLSVRVENVTDELYFARATSYADGTNVQVTTRVRF